MSELEQIVSLEHILDESQTRTLNTEEIKYVRRILYGTSASQLDIPKSAIEISKLQHFTIEGYKFDAKPEVFRDPRIVRIGIVQHQMPLSPSAPFKDQLHAVHDKISHIINAASLSGVNILCLQEAWNIPFIFCTREKYPYTEFAQDAENGPSIQFCCELAKKHNMWIISPILERDILHGEQLWNTAVVISNAGKYFGKSRKNHIPRVGDFNESSYYMEGNLGHPVFDTSFCKFGINICYGRHHPLNWLGFALNGAEIIFNPSATVGDLSEPMWPIEARNAAISNSVFTAAINRIGTEIYPNPFTSGDGKPAHNNFGHFYGSSYVSSPDGSRTPGLSRIHDGLLVTQIDLNLIRQIRDKWGFHMTSRFNLYSSLLEDYVDPNFKPNIVK